jgi:hypothetical protein
MRRWFQDARDDAIPLVPPMAEGAFTFTDQRRGYLGDGRRNQKAVTA